MCKKQSYVVSAAIVTAVVSIMLFFPMTGTAGSLDPTAAPAPTMKTLDQIPPTWDQILPANDSTTSDGCNSSRFKCVMGGAGVLDKETGLVWEQSPSTANMSWVNAMVTCQNKSVGNRKGWRLPTVEELATLVDLTTQTTPALPTGHPFSNVQSNSNGQWSATTAATNTSNARLVSFIGVIYGSNGTDKTVNAGVWCVRGGQGVDPQ